MFTSFGARTMTVRTERPSSAFTTAGAESASSRNVGLDDVRRNGETIANLAVDLDDAGDRLFNQQRRINARPAGVENRRLDARAAPTRLRPCRARTATA